MNHNGFGLSRINLFYWDVQTSGNIFNSLSSWKTKNTRGLQIYKNNHCHKNSVPLSEDTSNKPIEYFWVVECNDKNYDSSLGTFKQHFFILRFQLQYSLEKKQNKTTT